MELGGCDGCKFNNWFRIEIERIQNENLKEFKDFPELSENLKVIEEVPILN